MNHVGVRTPMLTRPSVFLCLLLCLCGAAPGASPDDTTTGPFLPAYHRALLTAYTDTVELQPLDLVASDYFGSAVGLDGRTAIVAAMGQDSDRGAAYIFRTVDGSAWPLAHKLTASDPAPAARFGHALAIDGNVTIVGAPRADDAGAAYVFRSPDGGQSWSEMQKLSPLSPIGSEGFGGAVSVHGYVAAVGAPAKDTADLGAVHVFVSADQGRRWNHTQVLLSGRALTDDSFGNSVALRGAILAVGANTHSTDHNAPQGGSVYIFNTTGAGRRWSQTQLLIAADMATGDLFGYALSLAGETLVVAATGRNNSTGGVYIYQSYLGLWSKVAVLEASDGEPGDEFGRAVSTVVGGTVVVGSYGHDIGSDANAGAVYVYRAEDAWSEAAKAVSTSVQARDLFGWSVSASGSQIVVGALLGSAGKGAAFVLSNTVLPTGQPSGQPSAQPSVAPSGNPTGQPIQIPELARIVASDGSTGDQFGIAVSTAGGEVAVGANRVNSVTGAVYIFAQPADSPAWNTTQILNASDAVTGDIFGTAVSMFQNTLVVGANGVSGNRGAAYVFTRLNEKGGRWSQTQILVPSDGAGGDNFGAAISVYGRVVAVGAKHYDVPLSNSGGVFIFYRADNGSEWNQTQVLIPADAAANDKFGISLCVRGSVMAVGTHLDDIGSVANAGSVTVFRTDDGGVRWSEVQTLLAADGQRLGQFGRSVAVYDTAVVVGTPYGTSGAGHVYIFLTTNASSWSQCQILVSTDMETGASFGYAVYASDTYLAVTATGFGASAGTVHVFTIQDGTWSEAASVMSSDAVGYGSALAVDGALMAVGAWEADSAVAVEAGSVYLYSLPSDPTGQPSSRPTALPTADPIDISEIAKLTAADGATGDVFGGAVALAGGVVAVGAANANQSTGTIYVYRQTNGWSETQALVAADGARGDQFGFAVSVSDGVLAAGAPGADNEGAVYLFISLADGLWSQTQRLVASAAGAYDAFGCALSIHGNVLTVGARAADIAALNAGAVYLFTTAGAGAEWSETQRLVHADPGANDFFGDALCLFADVLAVGTYRDDVGSVINAGSVSVFLTADGGYTWSAVQLLVAADRAHADKLGTSVAVSGTVIVAGATKGGGAVYVYRTPDGVAWSEEQTLVALDGAAGDLFGSYVGLYGAYIAVTAFGRDSSTGADVGRVYLYTDTGGWMWSEAAAVHASDETAGALFGSSVFLEGGLMAVGAMHSDTGAASESGSVYLFFLPVIPTAEPTGVPSAPSTQPSEQPSTGPSVQPSGQPSRQPIHPLPSVVPTEEPSGQPSSLPSSCPSLRPSSQPSSQPVSLFPVDEQCELLASDGVAGNSFGKSASLFETTAVVGAHNADGKRGATYVFSTTDHGATWSQEQKLVASDRSVYDEFGVSVSVFLDTVAVGAHRYNTISGTAGAVYIFTKIGGSFSEAQTLLASNGADGDYFGISVSLYGGVLAVGAYSADVALKANAGAVYTFVADAQGVWMETQVLAAGDGQDTDYFGISVSVSGGLLLVGAYRDDTGVGLDAGSSYIFASFDGGVGWTQVRQPVPSDAAPADHFGRSVALYAHTAVIGSYYDQSRTGSVYVFESSDGLAVWSETQKLVASDGAPGDEFGVSVSLYDDVLVVGSYLDTTIGGDTGSVYVFATGRGGGAGWSQMSRLVSASVPAAGLFGLAVSVYGRLLLVSAQGWNGNKGSAYVYALPAAPTVSPTGVPSLQPSTVPSDMPSSDPSCEPSSVPSVCPSARPSCQPSAYPSGVPSAIPSCIPTGVPTALPSHQPTFCPSGMPTGQPVVPSSIPTVPPSGYPTSHPSQLITEAGRLVASDGLSRDVFGFSVSAHGNIMAAGAVAPEDGDGAVYIYMMPAPSSSWSEVQKLLGPAGEQFGSAVSVFGASVAVGASVGNNGVSNSGVVYIFRSSDSGYTWTEVQKLRASSTAANYGASLAMDGSTIAVGARKDSSVNFNAGSVYVYAVDVSGAWSQCQKLSHGLSGDTFGWSVAVAAGVIVVGSKSDDVDSLFDAGSAVVFSSPDGYTWSAAQQLFASDKKGNAQFGYCVVLQDDVIVVGASSDLTPSVNTGSAYVFERAGTTWSEIQKLVPSGAVADDKFGQAITLQRGVLAVGAPGDDDSGFNAGTAYVYLTQGDGATWSEARKLTAPDGDVGNQFGYAVAGLDRTVFIGSPYAAVDEVPQVGNVWVYWLPTISPTGQPTSTPSSFPSGEPTLISPSSDPSSTPTDMPSSHPSGAPSMLPSGEPSTLPSVLPTCSPSTKPSTLPSATPSGVPSVTPSGRPTTVPSGCPSECPSGQPSVQPTITPSSTPTDIPSGTPSVEPSGSPSGKPSDVPSVAPSQAPSGQPSGDPSTAPTGIPSVDPTTCPSEAPSEQPSAVPSSIPSTVPSGGPTGIPSIQPSAAPSGTPTGAPSGSPSVCPTGQPSTVPIFTPTGTPTSQPSSCPSCIPSVEPSGSPSGKPSDVPSVAPSQAPSGQPSGDPSTAPTGIPSVDPTTCPSEAPSEQPSAVPSSIPSTVPSGGPTGIPSIQPSAAPSGTPTGAPSGSPSVCPTGQPSTVPIFTPTGTPTSQPSSCPSCIPSVEPSGSPSGKPSDVPSVAPSQAPSGQPSGDPSTAPTGIPSVDPTTCPSEAPSEQPSAVPSSIPSTVPSTVPCCSPTGIPSEESSSCPSSVPSVGPSAVPSALPSLLSSVTLFEAPSGQPSEDPYGAPIGFPSAVPSDCPSESPSDVPSEKPGATPSSTPFIIPSRGPTGELSVQPNVSPSSIPSGSPTGFPSTVPWGWLTESPVGVSSAPPSDVPAISPTLWATVNPVQPPSGSPSIEPLDCPSSGQPSAVPSSVLTETLSVQPSGGPSMRPARQPWALLSGSPSNVRTTLAPSGQPYESLSGCPSSVPSGNPSVQPTVVPSTMPTPGATVVGSVSERVPSASPSACPSGISSAAPSGSGDKPSDLPSAILSEAPSAHPSGVPSCRPSIPTNDPAAQSSSVPSQLPSGVPSVDTNIPQSASPSGRPSGISSNAPTCIPTVAPSGSATSVSPSSSSGLSYFVTYEVSHHSFHEGSAVTSRGMNILLGNTFVVGKLFSAFALFTDACGTVLNMFTLDVPVSWHEKFSGMVELPDGKVLLVGDALRNGKTVGILSRFDVAGRYESSTSLAWSEHVAFLTASRVGADRIVLAGHTGEGLNYHDIFVCLADISGAVLWAKRYADVAQDEATAVMPMSGGVLVGGVHSAGKDGFILLLDASGAIDKQLSLIGCHVKTLKSTMEGGFVAVGHILDTSDQVNGLVVIGDSSGGISQIFSLRIILSKYPLKLWDVQQLPSGHFGLIGELYGDAFSNYKSRTVLLVLDVDRAEVSNIHLFGDASGGLRINGHSLFLSPHGGISAAGHLRDEFGTYNYFFGELSDAFDFPGLSHMEELDDASYDLRTLTVGAYTRTVAFLATDMMEHESGPLPATVTTAMDSVEQRVELVGTCDVVSVTPLPTVRPTPGPPSVTPSAHPSYSPSLAPTSDPSTSAPTRLPVTSAPSRPGDTTPPTVSPTSPPSSLPSRAPTSRPSVKPTSDPSIRPSAAPVTRAPSSCPSHSPSVEPSFSPISPRPSTAASLPPTAAPTTIGAGGENSGSSDRNTVSMSTVGLVAVGVVGLLCCTGALYYAYHNLGLKRKNRSAVILRRSGRRARSHTQIEAARPPVSTIGPAEGSVSSPSGIVPPRQMSLADMYTVSSSSDEGNGSWEDSSDSSG